ncbi:hypothetical protein HHI36_015646 [Cryptolaemus montrouzieri]|uniref:Uncharacterized protein n=1 Tax=Cryptolaemus montrouzieri TaxID=559131 RepID=A0ABD2N7D3_9CUCU
MFVIGFRHVCICLLVQTIAGKSIELEYGYQEIDDKTQSQPESEEIKHIDVDRLSDEAIDEICRNFKVTIHIKSTESFINCLESPFDDTRQIKLVKRDIAEKEQEIEGSGDSEDQKLPPVDKISPEANESSNQSTNSPSLEKDQPPASEVESSTSKPKESEETAPPLLFKSGFDDVLKNAAQQNDSIKESENSPVVTQKEEKLSGSSDNTLPDITTPLVLFKNGFDDILKNAAQLNDSLKESENPVVVSQNGADLPEPSDKALPNNSENLELFKNGFEDLLKNSPQNTNSNPTLELQSRGKESIVQSSTSNGKPPAIANEDAKIGESQEKATAASPNSVLLIVFAAMGIVGALAFAFNFIKKRKEDKEIDEVMKLETEGRELKEMKPLMKSPLAQNGSKSLEYIDAEPQSGSQIEIRIETTQDKDLERHSN